MDLDKVFHDIYDGMQYIIAKNVINDLNLSGVGYVIVKGCPLAYYKTGKVETRLSNDIDILVSRQDIVKVEYILQTNDFRCVHKPNRAERVMLVSNSHQLPPYSKRMGRLYSQIDLNFDLFWGEYTGVRIDVSEFISDAVDMEIYGCQVKTLTPIKMLVQLILHHYKEMNSIYHLVGHLGVKSRYFEDVYMLCQRFQKEISVENLYRICDKYMILPFAFYLFYYTRQVYEDETLDKYLDALRTKAGENLLAYYGLAEEERKPWKIAFKDRLDTDISALILDEMTERDKEKLERNRRLFAGT